MSAHRTKNPGLAIVFAIALFVGACDSTDDNADLEQERNQLLIYLLYQSNALDYEAACLNGQASALSCADGSGIGSARTDYIGDLNAQFSIAVSSPQGTSEICNALHGSQFFATLSSGARVCYHDCTKAYWDKGSAEGNCSAASYASLRSGDQASINSCFETCLRDGTTILL